NCRDGAGDLVVYLRHPHGPLSHARPDLARRDRRCPKTTRSVERPELLERRKEHPGDILSVLRPNPTNEDATHRTEAIPRINPANSPIRTAKNRRPSKTP